jgi:CheY-like chemotaxis protein
LLDHPLSLRSRPGRGSRFRVTLPLAPAAPAQPAPLQASVEADLPLPERVLLIDDEAIVAQGLSALMKTWGVDLLAAIDEPSAAAALEQAHRQQRPVAVILSDMRLGQGVDGLQVARRLQGQGDHRPALVMITGETAPDRLRALEQAGLPVLFKPVDPLLLRRTLIEVVQANGP